MKITKKHWLILAAASLSMSMIVFGISHKDRQILFDWVGNVDRDYYQKMISIKEGMHVDDVIRILGEPALISEEKEIVQTHGKYGSGKDYGIKIANINKCLIYYHGSDIEADYFIDKDGYVYFVNVGGT